MTSIRTEDFDLSSTLESGQIFRYVRVTEGYLVHQGNRVFRVWQKGRDLFFQGVDEGFISDYFGLDTNYNEIVRTLRNDRSVAKALERYWGLRILRQDPWECLISFLCSSTKNISHIKVLVERLCRIFGAQVSLENYQGYTFPEERTINDFRRLEAIGLGFRARYIYEVNRIVGDGYLDDIRGRSYGEAKRLLMELPGVGEKVADCVLLFSMGFSQAFPVDTWIKRGMEEAFFLGQKTSSLRISAFAREHFGPFAGYAQQVLYHYWRKTGRSRSR
jgi:N-glycosylase/DNA lyase